MLINGMLSYCGEHERTGESYGDRVRLAERFWDVLAETGLRRQREPSVFEGANVKPFSIAASRWLRDRNKR